jgi:hypothetical protein
MNNRDFEKYHLEAIEKADKYTLEESDEGFFIVKNGRAVDVGELLADLNTYSVLMWGYHKSVEDEDFNLLH